MKSVLITLLLVSALSCRKSGDGHDSLLVGRWEIRKSEGGIGGTINYPPGNGNIQSYDRDGTFRWIDDGLMTQFGTYNLVRTSASGEWELTFHSNVYGAVWTYTILLTKDQFVIKAEEVCCDIPTITYSRIGN